MAKSKRSTSKKKTESKKVDLRPILRPLLRPEVVGMLFILLAGVSLLSLVFPGGSFGSRWNDLLRACFGWGAYLFPIVLVCFGLGLLWQRFEQSYRLRWQEAMGWLLLFVVCLPLLQVTAFDPDPSVNPIGGGYLGYWLYHSLQAAVGWVGAILIAIALGLVAICLAFSLTPAKIIVFSLTLGHRILNFYKGLWSAPRNPAGIDPVDVSLAEPQGEPGWEAAGAQNENTTPKTQKAKQTSFLFQPRSKPNQSSVFELPTIHGDWQLPPGSLLNAVTKGELSAADLRQKVKLIEDTLGDFRVQARVVEVNQGPTVTQFGVEPGFHETRDRHGNVIRREKVKVSEITSLSNDLALSLSASSLRIEAPVPGRSVVGIEVPNSSTSVVSLREVIESEKFQKLKAKAKLSLALGEDVSGKPMVADMAKMPHLLIAGATGSGKSVCLNSLIACLLLHTSPDELRFLMIDPKRVELTPFNDIPHLLRPVVVEVEKAVTVLQWAVHEMEERYKQFEGHRARNIDDYNKMMAREEDGEPMPYIVVVVDELADLMMTAPEEVERSICRLAQKARAVGIHLVVATQRPSVDVITGLIKANFPTRISFMMFSQIDSRTILDTPGAEKLLGRGDMLYMTPDAAKPVRLQGVFVSDNEIQEITSYWKAQGPARYVETLVHAEGWSPGENGKDEMYEKALEIAQSHNRVSTSLLQRRLRIGYSRAARLVDQLEEAGVVGPSEGGKSREVLLREEEDGQEREPREEAEFVNS
ncbi:MAG: DNA translocase FtsK [Chloroflexi bacterium]|nr:DNA translocase FtsK [Chloroflexota bacterium]